MISSLLIQIRHFPFVIWQEFNPLMIPLCSSGSEPQEENEREQMFRNIHRLEMQVPPLLARAIALEIKQCLEGKR